MEAGFVKYVRAAIGFEREVKGRSAGLKTFAFVCMGSALAMITNEYIFVYISQGTGDLSRMAAQVISGIGFLGAGTIIVTGSDKILGLTMAAALWVTASVGIAIGSGFYFGGVAGAVVLIISSLIYKMIDKRIATRPSKMFVCVDGVEKEYMELLIEYLAKSDIRVKSLVRKKERKWLEQDVCIVLELELHKRQSHKKTLEEIREIDGVRYCEEL